MDSNLEEASMSLAELVSLPTTLAFNATYTKNLEEFLKEHPYMRSGTVLGTGFTPIYLNIKNIPLLTEALGNQYTLLPAVLSPVDAQANSEAGITQVLEHPYLGLSGQGVIIGIVDTGIDYTKDVFRYEDNTSKIIRIWDQTIDGPRGQELYYGAEYSREQINEALQAANPFDVVPSRDDDGHGTFLASLAAGRKTDSYIGTAPDAELVVVKLRRTHDFFVNLLFLPPGKPNYFQNTDIMLGMQYILSVAKEQNKPVVFCIGLGSNDTGHDGYSLFEDYISYLSQRPGIAVVTAGGNESNAKHHTDGRLFRTGSTDRIGIRVGDSTASFMVNIFSAAYDKISIGIVSPAGEVISRIPFNVEAPTNEELLFDKTKIEVTYYRTTNSVVSIGFRGAKEGVWEIVLYGDSILDGEYHAWLPISYQVSPEVEFLKPVPEYTIVYPGNSLRGITCGAYDPQNNSLYVASSWGPTRLPRMAPDFVAPGVQVSGIYPTGPGTMTGTSAAAAVTAGAAAYLLEWGIIQGNLSSLDGDLVRQLLIGGCTRSSDQTYPNIKWGYGKLNLYGALWNIRESGILNRRLGGNL